MFTMVGGVVWPMLVVLALVVGLAAGFFLGTWKEKWN